MHKAKFTINRKISVIISIVIIILSFCPLFYVDGIGYTVLTMLKGTIEVSTSANPIGIALPFGVLAAVVLCIPVLYSIYILLLLLGKHISGYKGFLVFFSELMIVLTIGMIQLTGVVGEQKISVILFIVGGMVLIEYINGVIIANYLGEKADIEAYKKADKRRREERKKHKVKQSPQERKESGKMLVTILYKNLAYSWKSFLLLFSSMSISVLLVFVTVAIKNLLDNTRLTEQRYLGEQLSEVLKNTFLMIGILTILLMAMSLEHYVKSRMRNYGLFIALGIKRKMLHLFVAAEYMCCLMMALLAGCGGGHVAAFVLQKMIGYNLEEMVSVKITWLSVYGVTILICMLIFAFSTAINYEIFIERDLGNLLESEARKDRVPKRRRILGGISGIALLVIGSYLFAQRNWAESFFLLTVTFIGLYICLKFWGCIFLEYLRKRADYYKHLFYFNDFYYKFKKNLNQIFILCIIHTMVLYYFFVQVVSLFPLGAIEDLYPYDYVCMGEEKDDTYFAKLGKEYDIHMKKIPMVRITVDGGSAAYGNGFHSRENFQGHHVGLSASVFEKLTGERLELNNKEIHIIFQEDQSAKAHPLDWDGMREAPKIHSGGGYSYLWYERYRVFANDYQVKSEKRQIITGSFLGGIKEDIIVFSDTHYEELKKSAGHPAGVVAFDMEYNLNNRTPVGPTRLYLLKTPSRYRENIKEELETYDTTHPEYSAFDPQLKTVYAKEVLLKSQESERLLKFIVNLFLQLAMTLSGIYIIVTRLYADASYLRKKDQFLTCMGMTEEERKRTLYREIDINMFFPLGLGMIISGIFIGITAKLRFLTTAEVFHMVKGMALIWGIYIALQIVGLWWVKRLMKKEVLCAKK